MSQSSVISLTVFVAFIVYVTMKGELPKYLDLFNGSAQAPAATGGASNATTGAANQQVMNSLFGNTGVTPGLGSANGSGLIGQVLSDTGLSGGGASVPVNMNANGPASLGQLQNDGVVFNDPSVATVLGSSF